jgi:hypothetical protein
MRGRKKSATAQRRAQLSIQSHTIFAQKIFAAAAKEKVGSFPLRRGTEEPRK